MATVPSDLFSYRPPEVESDTNVKFNMLVNLVDAVGGNMAAHKERVGDPDDLGY